MKTLRIILLIIAISFTNNLIAQTKVYRTSKGEHYHKKECKIIAKSKVVELTIKKAKFRGYAACKVCKPKAKVKTSKKKVITEKKKSNKVKYKKSTSKKSTASRCTGITKKGARCKRRTKNVSGRCWQH